MLGKGEGPPQPFSLRKPGSFRRLGLGLGSPGPMTLILCCSGGRGTHADLAAPLQTTQQSQICVPFQALPLMSCVTLGGSFDLSEPHFPHLKNEDSFYFTGCVVRIKQLPFS